MENILFSYFQALYLATSPMYRYLLHHLSSIFVSILLLIVLPVVNTGSIGQGNLAQTVSSVAVFVSCM